MVWQIAAATGWSIRYILWGVNYPTLRIMLCDAPRYVARKTRKQTSLSGYFQSRINQQKMSDPCPDPLK